jgi:hypothetical protein
MGTPADMRWTATITACGDKVVKRVTGVRRPPEIRQIGKIVVIRLPNLASKCKTKAGRINRPA